MIDREQERLESVFRFAPVAGPVDAPERFLQSPRLGDERVTLEQLAQALSFADTEPLARFRSRWRAW